MKPKASPSVSRLRDIPSIDALMRRSSTTALLDRFDRATVLEAIRSWAGSIRIEINNGRSFQTKEDLLKKFDEGIASAVAGVGRASLRSVINATGVIIHTNLGRAPLAEEAVEAILRVGRGYSNLEYDLVKGGRGIRHVHCEALLRELLGCEAAVVVNNNAAAVLLVLNTLADGGEVIISRGELVEIGGSFRIPEIMAKSGAILREVGTTNRTRCADYEAAIDGKTRLILRVHQSNFKMSGFTERPSVEDLIALAHGHGLQIFEDLGSGCLVDLAPWGLAEEPIVSKSIVAGIDVCAFSGDKLLGGPQAGIIAGRRELVEAIRRNPWMRVVRPDKLGFAALEATLRIYRHHRQEIDLPVIQMVSLPAEEVRARARSLVRRVNKGLALPFDWSIVPGYSTTGGGTAPDSRIPTYVLHLSHSSLSAMECERAARSHEPPIITRIEDNRLALDLRTVKQSEEAFIVSCLRGLAAG